MTSSEQNSSEVIVDLFCHGLKMIQDRNMYCSGAESYIMADLIPVEENDRIIDLGSGTGTIPLILAPKARNCKIFGIEIQKSLYRLAERNCRLNRLEDKLTFINANLKDVELYFEEASFDKVVSNPPYFALHQARLGPNLSRNIARHEILCDLETVVRKMKKLVKPTGKMFIMVPQFRRKELFEIFAGLSIFPQRTVDIFPRRSRPPISLLVEAGCLPANQVSRQEYIIQPG